MERGKLSEIGGISATIKMGASSLFFYSQIFVICELLMSYAFFMKLLNEITYDFDIRGPKITASAKTAIIENVKQVVLISDTQVTVDTGRFYVTVTGDRFIISEIWEGRMELEGEITGIEFYKTSGKR
ncbi:hypothetical protein D1155_00360 [Anaerotruncus sp. 80]|jgi:hypothetical protein|uniref:Sporulation protein YqfC n=2 Tax=Bacillota TaxID=1239 RepID=A0A845QHH7_9FIRM|nr:hypothetical protein [Anaerotruncus colihominis]NCF00781.1 hypothetical protein [Anaerotruncus sp. 80]